MVEALVCTQDWVIDDPFGLIENFEEIEKVEQGNILFFLLLVCY